MGDAMRKITERAVSAFIVGQYFSGRNTRVSSCTYRSSTTDDLCTGWEMYLHGNRIAYRNNVNGTTLSLAGWNTVTTRDRLNGLLERMDKPWRFTQRAFEPYLIDIETRKLVEIRDWWNIDLRDMGRWFNA